MKNTIEKLIKAHEAICMYELNMKQTALLKFLPPVEASTKIDVNSVIEAPYKSSVLTTAFNHLRNARMFIGDILLELDKFQAYGGATKPLEVTPGKPKHLVLAAENVIDWQTKFVEAFKANLKGKPLPEGFSANAINSFLTPVQQELVAISVYKKFLADAMTTQGMFYFIAEMVDDIKAIHLDYLNEKGVTGETLERKRVAMKVYVGCLLEQLTLCNKHFGLRIGEIVE